MNLIQRAIALFISVTMLITFSACQQEVQPPKKEPIKRPDEAFLKYGETNETIVELSKVNNSVWVHTSYFEENGVLIPSNGLIVVTESGLVLIDTTRTGKQMESLDKLVHEAFNASFKEAIVTHAHPDRLGGASYLIKKNIPIASLEIVAKTAEKRGFIVPDQVSKGDSAALDIDNTLFEIYYPGEGHAPDNTVVWIDKYNVFYGGDLIMEYGASSLGDITGSNVYDWPASIKAVQERYPEIEIVIPSHGQWGDTSLIDYTLELLEE